MVANNVSISERVHMRIAYGRYWDNVKCRYDRGGPKSIRWFKRLSARTTRRIAARALRREMAEGDSA